MNVSLGSTWTTLSQGAGQAEPVGGWGRGITHSRGQGSGRGPSAQARSLQGGSDSSHGILQAGCRVPGLSRLRQPQSQLQPWLGPSGQSWLESCWQGGLPALLVHSPAPGDAEDLLLGVQGWGPSGQSAKALGGCPVALRTGGDPESYLLLGLVKPVAFLCSHLKPTSGANSHSDTLWDSSNRICRFLHQG